MTPTQPKAARLSAGDRPSFSRGGGASTTPLVGRDCGAAALLNGFTDIPPGTAIPFHFHNCEESVLVVAGDAVVEIAGGETMILAAGDVTWMPPGLAHRFRNPSATETLRIFWTYAAADATRTLVDSGETVAVAAEKDGSA